MIDGSETTISNLICDPVFANTGLSSLIKASDAINPNSIFDGTIFDEFKNATDINTQITKFIELIINNPNISFNFGSTPTSLSNIISAAINPA